MIEKGESNDSESQTDRKRLNYITNNQKCGNSYLIDKSYAFSFMVVGPGTLGDLLHNLGYVKQSNNTRSIYFTSKEKLKYTVGHITWLYALADNLAIHIIGTNSLQV